MSASHDRAATSSNHFHHRSSSISSNYFQQPLIFITSSNHFHQLFSSTLSQHRILRLLLQNGANFRGIDSEGNSALDYARAGNSVRAASVLVSFNEDLTPSEELCIRNAKTSLGGFSADEDDKIRQKFLRRIGDVQYNKEVAKHRMGWEGRYPILPDCPTSLVTNSSSWRYNVWVLWYNMVRSLANESVLLPPGLTTSRLDLNRSSITTSRPRRSGSSSVANRSCTCPRTIRNTTSGLFRRSKTSPVR